MPHFRLELGTVSTSFAPAKGSTRGLGCFYDSHNPFMFSDFSQSGDGQFPLLPSSLRFDATQEYNRAAAQRSRVGERVRVRASLITNCIVG